MGCVEGFCGCGIEDGEGVLEVMIRWEGWQ